METRILGTTEKDIKEAAKILQNGGLVAFPTETVYGLGADALNPEAVSKVYEAKGRPSDNPMIVHISQPQQLYQLTFEITDDMKTLMETFWPGPLTMITPARPEVPRVTTGGLDTVAVRMPGQCNDSRVDFRNGETSCRSECKSFRTSESDYATAC